MLTARFAGSKAFQGRQPGLLLGRLLAAHRRGWAGFICDGHRPALSRIARRRQSVLQRARPGLC